MSVERYGAQEGDSHWSGPTHTRRILVIFGVVLLLIGLGAATSHLLGVKQFSSSAGLQVKADTTYYLLVGTDGGGNGGGTTAGDLPICSAETPEGTPAADSITAEILATNTSQMDNVALPLTAPKGVAATLTFAEDFPALRHNCTGGTTYLTTYSAGTLTTLTWLALVGVAAGLVLLAAAGILTLRARSARDDEWDDRPQHIDWDDQP